MFKITVSFKQKQLDVIKTLGIEALLKQELTAEKFNALVKFTNAIGFVNKNMVIRTKPAPLVVKFMNDQVLEFVFFDEEEFITKQGTFYFQPAVPCTPFPRQLIEEEVLKFVSGLEGYTLNKQ